MANEGRGTPDVFVVDDDPCMLRCLRRLVEHEGCRAICFSNAADAWNAIALTRPCLVISDNCMAGLEGIAFLKRVRLTYPYVRTMLVTAGLITEEIASAVNSGEIDAYFPKPWNQAAFIDRLRSLVCSRQQLASAPEL